MKLLATRALRFIPLKIIFIIINSIESTDFKQASAIISKKLGGKKRSRLREKEKNREREREREREKWNLDG